MNSPSRSRSNGGRDPLPVVNSLTLAGRFSGIATADLRDPPRFRAAQDIRLHGTQDFQVSPWTTTCFPEPMRASAAWLPDFLLLRFIGQGSRATETAGPTFSIYSVNVPQSDAASIYAILASPSLDPKPATNTLPATSVSANPKRTLGSWRIQRLSRIQAAFGFPLKTVAEILQRSRTQLYKWLDASEIVDLHGESLQRLTKMARLAERWLAESSVPLASIAHEPLPTGTTIVELLSASTLDEGAIVDGFKYLAELAKNAPPTVSQRLRDRGFERRKRTLPNDD